MPDVPPVTAPVVSSNETNPGTPAPPVLIAGKYASDAAFDKGLREIAKANGAPIADATKLWGEGGFWPDRDTAVKGYKALESAYGSRKTETPAAGVEGEAKPEGKPATTPAPDSTNLTLTPPASPAGDTAEAEPADLDALITSAGLKKSDLEAEWAKSGALTTEQYAALAKKGLPKVAANHIAEGLASKAILVNQIKLAEMAKADAEFGADAHKSLREWAGANMAPARLAALDAQVLNNPGFYGDMMRLVHMEWQKATGTEGSGTPVKGTPSSSVYSTGAFTSQAEANAAFLDKRYAPTLPGGSPNPHHSPAYRAATLKRMAASQPR